jgi:hypothetical protein
VDKQLTPRTPEEIGLHLHGQGIQSHEIIAPLTIETQDFIRDLVRSLNLPEVGEDGKFIVWEVDDKQTGHSLAEGKTLGENGVRAGHHLYLNRKQVTPPPVPPRLSTIALLVVIALIPVAGVGSYLWASGQKRPLEEALAAANQRASAAEAHSAQLQLELNDLRDREKTESNALKQNADSRQAQLTADAAQISQLHAAVASDQIQIKNLQTTIQSLHAHPRYGWLTWTGNIPNNKIVTIVNNQPTVGLLSDGRLPGADCTVEAADPQRVSIVAGPNASTAWNQLVFRVEGRGKTTVRLLWVMR